jgi:hypothetical protein
MLEMLNLITFMHETISHLFYLERMLKSSNVFLLKYHINN